MKTKDAEIMTRASISPFLNRNVIAMAVLAFPGRIGETFPSWSSASRSVMVASLVSLALGRIGYGVFVRRGANDMRLDFQRGTVFLMSLVAIALMFFSLEFFVEKFFYGNDEVVDIFASVVGAFAFSRFKLFFEKATDGIFFRGQYDYVDATARASEAFSSTIDLHALAAAMEGFLGTTIKPGWVDFFWEDAKTPRGFSPVSEDSSSAILDEGYATTIESFFRNGGGGDFSIEFPVAVPIRKGAVGEDHGDWSASDVGTSGIGAMVPIISRKHMNALLVLGKKRSGDSYSTRDKKLLTVISRQIGMAVENVRLYEAAKRHAEDLERRVAERTERVKNMHEAQSKFLADLSHEFQTPLTILKMNVETFADGSVSDRRRASYTMETTLDRLSRLTSGLVDVARFSFSEESFRRQRIDFAELLTGARDDCLILAKDKGITLSAESEKIFVLGDRDKLREVLLNLVGNALKHTAAGGFVALVARRKEREAEIIVADSGVGIPLKNLSRIFERFYRIDDRVSEGAGLGLHLCRKIVEAHKGTIVAESSMGQGSRFVIHLPLERAE